MAEAAGQQGTSGSQPKTAGSWWIPGQVTVIAVTLAACGLLAWETYACAVLFSAYIVWMGRYAYPKHKSEPQNAPSFVQQGSHILKIYVRFAAYIGLYFPFSYILLGYLLRHQATVHTAAPHTFLLACQVLSERLSSYSKAFSPPSLALVPILYNSGRLISIWCWLQADFFTPAPLSSWLVCGRALVVANLLLWSYNLFGFLLPLYLPFCFRRYFEHEKA